MMNKKIFIAIGIIVILTVSFACVTSKNIPTENNKPLNRNWLYEGPIYETHPYYYPNLAKPEPKKR